MLKSLVRNAVLAAVLIVVTGLAAAQYIGPGTALARTPTSLNELLLNPLDGQGVQLRGRLLQQLNHNKYLFSDGKSQIRVQVNAEIFPKQAIDDSTEIEILGRVEKDFMETPEIDVSSIETVVQPLPSKKR